MVKRWRVMRVTSVATRVVGDVDDFDAEKGEVTGSRTMIGVHIEAVENFWTQKDPERGRVTFDYVLPEGQAAPCRAGDLVRFGVDVAGDLYTLRASAGRSFHLQAVEGHVEVLRETGGARLIVGNNRHSAMATLSPTQARALAAVLDAYADAVDQTSRETGKDGAP